MKEIFVSVIMPIYKTDRKFLSEAINSILRQTHKQFELIAIIDEEPEFNTRQFLEDIHDNRIKILDNGRNRGLVYSLNRALDYASGKYIFRMDSDDIAIKDRLEKQIEYLETHTDVDVLGTFAETFGDYHTIFMSSTGNEQLRGELLWSNPLVHPTVGFKTEFIKNNKICYTEGDSEDYRLWLELAFKYDCIFAVLPDILLKYRTHSQQITYRDKEKIKMKEFEITSKILEYCSVTLTKEQIDLLCTLKNNEHIKIMNIPESLKVLSCIERKIDNSVSRCSFRNKYIKGLMKSLR